MKTAADSPCPGRHRRARNPPAGSADTGRPRRLLGTALSQATSSPESAPPCSTASLPEAKVSSSELAAEGGLRIPFDFYSPRPAAELVADGERLPAFLLTHGLVHEGYRDARVIAMARRLARAGFAVMAPGPAADEELPAGVRGHRCGGRLPRFPARIRPRRRRTGRRDRPELQRRSDADGPWPAESARQGPLRPDLRELLRHAAHPALRPDRLLRCSGTSRGARRPEQPAQSLAAPARQPRPRARLPEPRRLRRLRGRPRALPLARRPGAAGDLLGG